MGIQNRYEYESSSDSIDIHYDNPTTIKKSTYSVSVSYGSPSYVSQIEGSVSVKSPSGTSYTTTSTKVGVIMVSIPISGGYSITSGFTVSKLNVSVSGATPSSFTVSPGGGSIRVGIKLENNKTVAVKVKVTPDLSWESHATFVYKVDGVQHSSIVKTSRGGTITAPAFKGVTRWYSSKGSIYPGGSVTLDSMTYNRVYKSWTTGGGGGGGDQKIDSTGKAYVMSDTGLTIGSMYVMSETGLMPGRPYVKTEEGLVGSK